MQQELASAGDRVLLVEDNATDALLVREAIRMSGRHVEIEHVTDLASANSRLRHGEILAVILDLGLPDSHGIDTVAGVVGSTNVPVLVLTGQLPDRIRDDVILQGSAGFVSKNDLGTEQLVALLDELTAKPHKPSNWRWNGANGGNGSELNFHLHRATAWLDVAANDINLLQARSETSDSTEAPLNRIERAIEAANEEVEGAMQLATLVQGFLPEGPHAESLGAVLGKAVGVLATELAPTFEVSLSSDVTPDLPVDGTGFVKLLSAVASAIRSAIPRDTSHARMKLRSHQVGELVTVAIDAEVPSFDEGVLKARLDSIALAGVYTRDFRTANVELRSVRGWQDLTLVCLEIALSKALPARTASSRELWWVQLDEVARLVERREHSLQQTARLLGGLTSLVRLWPSYSAPREQLLDQVEGRAPWLQGEVSRAREDGNRLHRQLCEARSNVARFGQCADLSHPSDQAALDRLWSEVKTWCRELRADDERLAKALIESLWDDVEELD